MANCIIVFLYSHLLRVCAHLVFLFEYSAYVCEAQEEESVCVCAGGEEIMSGSAVGGFSSLQGGGEVDFFPHPFFMAFLLSDLQPLYIRLTVRFSFISKHLFGTVCVCVSGGERSHSRPGVSHLSLMTIRPLWSSFADVLRFLNGGALLRRLFLMMAEFRDEERAAGWKDDVGPIMNIIEISPHGPCVNSAV